MIMTDEEIESWKSQIDKMSQEDMARLWRFAKSGHPVFNETLPLFEYFNKKFKGFTSEISKKIGW